MSIYLDYSCPVNFRRQNELGFQRHFRRYVAGSRWNYDKLGQLSLLQSAMNSGYKFGSLQSAMELWQIPTT